MQDLPNHTIQIQSDWLLQAFEDNLRLLSLVRPSSKLQAFIAYTYYSYFYILFVL